MVRSIEPSLATECCPHTGGPCRTLNNAALPYSAVRYITVINAWQTATAITPARTVTVPSAVTNKPMIGSQPNRTYYSPSLLLTAEKFIRRFLQHVLPSRFVKMRYYGLLSP